VKRQAPTFSASDLFTQSNAAVTPHGIEGSSLSANQIDLSQSATSNLQVLTQHLNDFLTQGMGPVQSGASSQSLPLTTPAFDAPAHITMELLSMQPDPLAHSAGLNLEHYTAQIKVHPQELGQITAKIEVNNGIATITFLTEHAHVKQLMEANLPELRQAFQHSSLNLNNVDVHHGGSQDKKEPPAYVNPDEEEDVVQGKIVNKATESHGVQTNRSIIDTYA
jgi:flagellar hook-length control protein FliK